MIYSESNPDPFFRSVFSSIYKVVNVRVLCFKETIKSSSMAVVCHHLTLI